VFLLVLVGWFWFGNWGDGKKKYKEQKISFQKE
jgi:hypothetical protein